MDNLENFEAQIWYFENSGYHVPERKLFETEHQYKKELLKYNDRHCNLSLRLHALYAAIEQALAYYDRELKSFEELNYDKALINMPIPILAKSSTLDDVENTLESYEPFYSTIPVQGYENVYELIKDRKQELLFKIRFDFIKDAIEFAPEKQPIIFIESSYDPIDSDCEDFFDCLEKLEKEGGSLLPRIYYGVDLQWFAFDSRSITDDRIKYLATEWKGDPDSSHIFYSPR